MDKMVYLFDEGDAAMRDLLGGKGAGLAEMTRIGLPVPPGLTVTTAVCRAYYREGGRLPADLPALIKTALAEVEARTGRRLGDKQKPLLLSVRSGAKYSMPGMMNTVLNLGINDETLPGLTAMTGNRRFALDAYRRFLQMYADVVLSYSKHAFDALLEERKRKAGVQLDQELNEVQLAELVADYKQLYARLADKPFPSDPFEQLLQAVEAVFRSWNTERAKVYRELHAISHDLGTAVNIQAMVFGNMGATSGSGVAFTRNPANGRKEVFGEYLVAAQGEDVVAGIRTPNPIAKLRQDMPGVYEQFIQVTERLEKHYQDMQDIEFTVEAGKLYILQTRNGKRTGQAAVKIAHDLANEGTITREKALLLVEPAHLEQVMHRQVDESNPLQVIARGLPASPGAAVGRVVFSADEAAKKQREGEKVILVRLETTPEDIHGIVAAEGILTSRGGMTSHAAVVARGMGKPCICGCEALKIDYDARQFQVDGLVVKAGDLLSLDGASGRVMLGEVAMCDPELSPEYEALLRWADDVAQIKVRANADTPADAALARAFGATGIGLCRTEHMFMAADRLPYVQQMILAGTLVQREAALKHLLPMQEADFYGIFSAMEGLPVTIRLLDPPLHEFLPKEDEVLTSVLSLRLAGDQSRKLAEREALLAKVRELKESNPMLGHRGCRLGLTYPEIYDMQIKAIFLAVARLLQEGKQVLPEIEIPLTVDKRELDACIVRVQEIARRVSADEGVAIKYLVGTMIELPRAALLADELAASADFFSFGTNDLTQTTFGFSRDDAEAKFLPHYLRQGLLEENPFAVLDQRGVGALMKLAIAGGRGLKPALLIGICGEHGGEPRSIAFCHEIGLDYVSCSPYRVPIARLAAAQAALAGAAGGGTK